MRHIVKSTATCPVVFTSANVSPVAGNWEGIRIRSSANLSMSHATVEFADNGVSFIGSRSNGLITNSQVTQNIIGVHVDAQYQALSNHPTPVINNSQIFNNVNYQYYTRNFSSGSSRTLNARGNWWGSNDATTIAAGIYDNSDNSGLPHVDSGQFHYTNSEAAVLALAGSNLAYGTVSTEFSVALSNGAVINDTQWQQVSGPTVTLNAGSDAASVNFLSADVASDHTVSLSVTAQDENGIYSYAIIDIQLRPFAAFNSPPNVPDSLQQLVYSSDLVNVVMTATDSDPLTYQWTQTFGETVTLADSSSNTLSFTAPGTSENILLGFSLVVSDGTYDIQREVTIGVKRQQDTAGTYYYHNDHLGTPQALTDNSQTVVWQASYTPFGEAAISTDIVENNIRFPGQYYDQESGLHYNYFRDYDPQSGRYIQSDPIGLVGGINTYGYVGGNPIRYIDPMGLARCTYSISTSSLICTSNTINIPNFIGPHEIRELNPQNVHSGRGEHKNNPTSVDVQNHGPIWPGVFNMTPNELPGREGWWALQEPGWTKFDSLQYRLGLKRAGANLHMGTISHGFITVDPSEQEQFNQLTGLLGREAGDNILTVVP